MGYNKPRAHSEALSWWNISGRTDAGCDKCGSTIRRGEGYLCNPSMGFAVLGAVSRDTSPDLLCEQCFDRSSTATAFEGDIQKSLAPPPRRQTMKEIETDAEIRTKQQAILASIAAIITFAGGTYLWWWSWWTIPLAAIVAIFAGIGIMFLTIGPGRLW